MTYPMLADIAASLAELQENPLGVLASGEGMPIVVLNSNKPEFYCVPANVYEAMMELIEDLELLKIVKERQQEESIAVKFDDL